MKEADEKELDKQVAELLEKSGVDDKVHCADPKKSYLSTLCGKPTSLAKTSMKDADITCEICRGLLNRITALGF